MVRPGPPASDIGHYPQPTTAMRTLKMYTVALQIGVLIVLLALAARLASQPIHSSAYPGATFETTVGSVSVEQCEKDIITFTYNGNSTDVHFSNLDKCGPDVWTRANATILMADDAAVIYRIFIRENELRDNWDMKAYYAVCLAVRESLKKAVPERVLTELAFRLKAIR